MRQLGPRILMLLAAGAAFLKVALPEGVPLGTGLASLSGSDWMAMIGALYLAYTSPTQFSNGVQAVKDKVARVVQ